MNECRELTAIEALNYLDDIAHGRKMEYDPHLLFNIVKKHLEAGEKAHEILKIVYDAPFIIESLFRLDKLGEQASRRYIWATVSDKDVEKVKEFFADGKRD